MAHLELPTNSGIGEEIGGRRTGSFLDEGGLPQGGGTSLSIDLTGMEDDLIIAFLTTVAAHFVAAAAWIVTVVLLGVFVGTALAGGVLSVRGGIRLGATRRRR